MAKLEPTDNEVETQMPQLLLIARGESNRSVDDAWRSDVKSLISTNWATRPQTLQLLFRDWLIDVALTANFRVIMDGLVTAYCRSFAPTIADEKLPLFDQSEFYYCLIRDLCCRVPVSMQTLPAIVLQNQPILRRPVQMHSAYCSAVLHLSIAARLVRRQLISAVISHLLGLDVRLPREIVLCCVKQQQLTKMQPEVADLLTKMDQCMDACFEFIEKLPELSLSKNSNGDSSIDLICEFFVDVLAAFDAVVFRSSSASHINFILFYACARYPQLAALMLDHLWARIIAEDKADESRRAALFYFASFVARAKFLTLDQLRTSVEHLAQLAHFMRSKIAPSAQSDSINKSDQIPASSACWIGLFDAAVEALIYVVSFHHATLCSGSLGFRFVRSLKLGELINCPSEPLSRCRESVVGMFYQVADRYQLSLSDRLSRNSCRTESMCSMASTPGDDDTSENPMLLAAAAVESSIVSTGYFPFDPYMLPHSSPRLRPFYAEFDATDLLVSSDESDSDSDSESDDDDIEFENEDDDKMAL